MNSVRRGMNLFQPMLLGFVVMLCAREAHAVINAGLQPYDLFSSRYSNVAVLRVTESDSAAETIPCEVVQSLKGRFIVGQKMQLALSGVLQGLLSKGRDGEAFKADRPIVAFVGRRRKPNDVMIYADNFYLGSIGDPEHWVLDRDSESIVGTDGQAIDTLQGTWNGSTDQLVRLLEDVVSERDHFPRKAYARFREDLLIDQFDAPVQGVAIYDIEGDGDQDIVACSPAGDRIYLQTDDMKFVNGSAALQLDSRSAGCSLADVNADGLTDLLLGSTLYLGTFDFNTFTFTKQTLLPEDLATGLKVAAFVELNGDGSPDIVASQAGKGLRAFHNNGRPPVAFTEATEAMGLTRPECGAGGDGYFAAGDWNGDLNGDLFYAVDPGYLLVQNAQGVFQPIPHDIQFKFTVGAEDLAGRTGAGVFMPVLGPAQMDLVVPLVDGWLIIANRQGTPEDITMWGNEISEGSNDHLATIGEDLNLDGHIDLYTVSAAENGHNRFILNRGYGSFMLASVHKHYEHMFKGPAEQLGGLGAASGDVNGDGMPDLLIGNMHGHLTLTLNDTMPARATEQHPPREIAQLQLVRLLTVNVMGSKGVTNARIRVYDKVDKLIARRDLGMNIAGGCAGPNKVTIALRQPDEYTLKVQYSDGLEREVGVDLRETAQTLINVDRGEQDHSDVW